jgi:L-alanine-DL-glutamate epimerase-like enolase superfamily enzyme
MSPPFPLRIDRGYVEVPQQAGLGIEIDSRIRLCQEQFKRVA